MNDELTPGERADLDKYSTDLAAEIAAMDAVELGLLAKRAEIDAPKYPERADLEAAIKEKAAADYAKGKLELRNAAAEQNRRVDEEEANRPPAARAIRALHAEFVREVPEELRSSGAIEPGEGHPRFGGDYAVENGKYRVVGGDFIYEFKGKRLVRAFTATESNNWGGKGVKHVD